MPSVAQEDYAAFWIIDSPEDANADAAFTLRDAAAVEHFRSEGKTALLQCVRSGSLAPLWRRCMGRT